MNNPVKANEASVGRAWPLSLVLIFVFFLMIGGSVPATEIPDANAPQFLDSFAVSSLWGGQDWRIFVRGEDPNGEMDHIWVVVSQAGGASYDNHVIRLKGSERKAFFGYINFPIPRFPKTGWEYLKVEMRIRDTLGRYSQPRVQEVTIGSPTKESIPPEWQTAENRQLGTIFFDFEFNTGESNGIFIR